MRLENLSSILCFLLIKLLGTAFAPIVVMGLKHCRDFLRNSIYAGISDGFWRAYQPKCHWNSVEASENLSHLSVSHFTVSLKGGGGGGGRRGKQKSPHTWWFVLGYYSDESCMKTHTVLTGIQTCRYLSEKKTEKENKFNSIILNGRVNQIYLDEIIIWILIWIFLV